MYHTPLKSSSRNQRLVLFQGANVGKGGIDTTPSEERAAPAPPEHLKSQTEAEGSPESLTKDNTDQESTIANKLLPRETGDDIGMGSPVPLSNQAVTVITRLRNMKVCQEFQCTVSQSQYSLGRRRRLGSLAGCGLPCERRLKPRFQA